MQTQGPHQAETGKRWREKLAQTRRKAGRDVKKKTKTIHLLTLQYSSYTFIEIMTMQSRILRREILIIAYYLK